MSNFTHYVKINKGKGRNYYLGKYHFKDDAYTGVDANTASYLRRDKERFEVITKNQYEKLFKVKETKDSNTSSNEKDVEAKENDE